MTIIATVAFRPMLRPTRKVHLPGTPGIYNTKPLWKPGPKWQPQTPSGPWMDGWGLGGATFTSMQGGLWWYTWKLMFLTCIGLWTPIFAVEYQIKKANAPI